MKYRDNMTPEELEQFKAEVSALDAAYAAAAAQDAANTEPIPDECEDPSDYAGMGWVGKDGRP
jgi:hypothetical protein